MEKELIEEFRRRVIHESIQRIKTCLNMVDESKLWFRQNDEVNSIGNLILHLDGNARQWVFSGIGNVPDKRDRSSEFIPDQNITCLLYTSPSPRDRTRSRMPSSA